MKVKNYFIGLIALSLFAVSCSKEMEPVQDVPIVPDNQEEVSELTTLKSGVVVKKRGDKYFYEGDIVLSEQQLKSLDEKGDFLPLEKPEIDEENSIPVSLATGYKQISGDVNLKSNAIYPTSYNLWAMVRFTYSHSTTGTTLNSYTKSLVKEALEYWEAHSNVRFYNATNEPVQDPTYGFYYPYVNFCDGSHNQSYVGRIGGRQDLTLVPYGCSVGTVIHEIGHAIGLLHEHNRYDRDNYVNVHMSNIKQEYKDNFYKRTSNYYCIGTFDFNSVMMYSSYTGFEINTSQPSLTRKDGTTWWGQRQGLSTNDRLFPNTFYLPYIARSDTYRELDDVVYKQDGSIMTPSERLQLQAQLNYGNPNPPPGGRIPNNF